MASVDLQLHDEIRETASIKGFVFLRSCPKFALLRTCYSCSHPQHLQNFAIAITMQCSEYDCMLA